MRVGVGTHRGERGLEHLPVAMTPSQAALVFLMGRYLAALMDVGITLLEIHKLMYFLQEAGEPLRLRFKQAPYGPYAENLRHVLIEIDGHFMTGYGEGRDNPDRVIVPTEIGLREATTFLSGAEVHGRADRVGTLIEGFETPFGMELLSTVHWVAAHGGATTLDDATREVYGWNERKRMFAPEHIAAAWKALERGGWLGTTRTAGGT